MFLLDIFIGILSFLFWYGEYKYLCISELSICFHLPKKRPCVWTETQVRLRQNASAF